MNLFKHFTDDDYCSGHFTWASVCGLVLIEVMNIVYRNLFENRVTTEHTRTCYVNEDRIKDKRRGKNTHTRRKWNNNRRLCLLWPSVAKLYCSIDHTIAVAAGAFHFFRSRYSFSIQLNQWFDYHRLQQQQQQQQKIFIIYLCVLFLFCLPKSVFVIPFFLSSSQRNSNRSNRSVRR